MIDPRRQATKSKGRTGCPVRPLKSTMILGKSVIDLLLNLVGGLGDIATCSTDILTNTTHGVASGERQGGDGNEG